MNCHRQIIKQKWFTNCLIHQFSFEAVKKSSLQHNVSDFDCLDKTLAHCYGKRAVLSCILFTAAWNPRSSQAGKDFEILSNQFFGFDFVRIDTDKSQRAKAFFGVRCEPEVMIYLQGMKMVRQIGPSLENLTQKLQKVQAYQTQPDVLDGTNEWEDFHAQFRYEWKYSHRVFDNFAR